MNDPVIIGDATLLAGDVREALRGLPAESIQCCITSPPYWGLRAYGTEPQVWGGDAGCNHEFDVRVIDKSKPGTSGSGLTNAGASQAKSNRFRTEHGFCRCGAWRGELGQEPTPALFVEHLVEVFREVRRVLRPDGVMWVNMGDCYAHSGACGGGSPDGPRPAREHDKAAQKSRGGTLSAGLKPKDLCEIPSDVVRALRADGWWLRSRIPWLKRNAMPESTDDRPASAVEYVFLLTPSGRYFYDHEAGKMVQAGYERERRLREGREGLASVYPLARDGQTGLADQSKGGQVRNVKCRSEAARGGSRARRNSDWFFESWQGLYSDEAGNPLAFIVNPAGFKAAHFATFPPKLVEPMVKVGTSEKGCCPKCGTPWERVVEKDGAMAESRQGDPTYVGGTLERGKTFASATPGYTTPSRTLGWRPGCECGGEPVPCTVLDPFSGAGTTCMVAALLGRRAIGIDLKEEYNRMAAARIGKALRPATFVDEQAETDMPLLAEKEPTLPLAALKGFTDA